MCHKRFHLNFTAGIITHFRPITRFTGQNRKATGTMVEIWFKKHTRAWTLFCAACVCLFVLCLSVYLHFHATNDASTAANPHGQVAKLAVNSSAQKSAWLSHEKSDHVREIVGLFVTDAVFDGVKVKIYKPDKSEQTCKFPALVYFHGGGWINFNANGYQKLLTHIALETHLIVISVDYKLAPEYKFPIPFDDCLTATKYVFSNHKDLGVDPTRVAIGGDSAGGNLAAAVALKLRDEHHKPQPTRQILIYPPLQAVDFRLPSYVQNNKGPSLRTSAMAMMWSDYATGTDEFTKTMARNHHTTLSAKKRIYDEYINHEDIPLTYRYKPYESPSLEQGHEEVWEELRDVLFNPYFAPLMAGNFSNLPAAFIYTAQHDILRDDGLLYAKRLRDSGVAVTLVNGPESVHGVCNAFIPRFRGSEKADNCLHQIITYLRKYV